ncbi:protein LURP-one-related 14-like [Hibiscus syriacus]|uniref:protein LURP-one-related 14-like n=1 Tax=Hibiscus syriacus TaxID=106335 RepID=UPI001920E203|nr:protein LURP-one-related 14-like [Hibiscus syriacus]
MATDEPTIKIIGDQFCVSYTLHLNVKRKVESFSHAHYDMFDSNGDVLLQIDGGAGVWNSAKKIVIKDHAGSPVITLRNQQTSSWKKKWQIYEGESVEQNHCVCSVQQSDALQIKNDLDVYLASNYKEDGPDFHVTASITSLSFKVWKGNLIIDEVKHNYTWGSCQGKESFKVKVYPEVDYAFILALVVIMHETENV